MASRTERTVINAAGLVQGIVLVTFPAASTIFTDTSQYGLSSSRYGAMFLPQVALAAEQGNHRQPARHAGGPYQRMLAAGTTEDQITDVLLAIAPVAGLGRVVTAVPGVSDAFGYFIEAALEDPDGH